MQCCCKRFDSRTAACFAIEFYDNRATAEAVRDDLRCTGRLTPKNTLMAEQTERHHRYLTKVLSRRVLGRNIGDKVRKKATSGALSQRTKDPNVITNLSLRQINLAASLGGLDGFADTANSRSLPEVRCPINSGMC